jgi:hypothetical protein
MGAVLYMMSFGFVRVTVPGHVSPETWEFLLKLYRPAQWLYYESPLQKPLRDYDDWCFRVVNGL